MSEKMTFCSRKSSLLALTDFFFFFLTVNFTIVESCKLTLFLFLAVSRMYKRSLFFKLFSSFIFHIAGTESPRSVKRMFHFHRMKQSTYGNV